jgi:multidrug transporter EmrE-like cation transporter
MVNILLGFIVFQESVTIGKVISISIISATVIYYTYNEGIKNA